MPPDRNVCTPEQLVCFHLTEVRLREAIAFSEAYGGPVIDGSQFSPSDRAIEPVERVWQSATPEQWESFDWALSDLYDALDLIWVDGVLWRADDAPDPA